jgi:hypothetical protein
LKATPGLIRVLVEKAGVAHPLGNRRWLKIRMSFFELPVLGVEVKV